MLELPEVGQDPAQNLFPVLYWNHVGLEMNRITHSLGGPQAGPTMSSRALGLLHLAMHDAFFGWLGNDQTSDPPTYLPVLDTNGNVVVALPPLDPGRTVDLAHANAALTAAALAVLDRLYVGTATGVSADTMNTLEQMLGRMMTDYRHPIETLTPEHEFGTAVANIILDRLAVKPGEIGAQQGRYEPRQGPYYFRDEPVTPVRRVPIDPDHPERGTKAQRIYHGPFYGVTVADFAVTDPNGHKLADPPRLGQPGDAYLKALQEVVRLGGAPGLPTTKRPPDGTVAALYWAYDGANLIGTPPRLYNQVLRELAWARKATDDPADQAQNEEFVRLFALANVAMADAGKFSWKEKYRFEFWRPLSGVREHHTIGQPAGGHAHLPGDGDPFWLALGAPETNTNRVSFKPPFPAYPSGHATFGAACFQMARLFYNQGTPAFTPGDPAFDPNAVDALGFSFVSEELNGVSRDLRQDYDPTIPIEDQPGTVRTRVERSFPSLWAAIFENAFSRIWLGVHWNFDAGDPADIQVDPAADEPVNKPADQIAYSHVWTAKRAAGDPLPVGGVPLGLGIANDIFGNGMRAPAQAMGQATTPSAAFLEPQVQRSSTPVR